MMDRRADKGLGLFASRDHGLASPAVESRGYRFVVLCAYPRWVGWLPRKVPNRSALPTNSCTAADRRYVEIFRKRKPRRFGKVMELSQEGFLACVGLKTTGRKSTKNQRGRRDQRAAAPSGGDKRGSGRREGSCGCRKRERPELVRRLNCEERRGRRLQVVTRWRPGTVREK
jgi:hypothetical protein